VKPDREAILARYDFPLDRFQIEAIDALDDGDNVVVAGRSRRSPIRSTATWSPSTATPTSAC
jgi:hypothetical protein